MTVDFRDAAERHWEDAEYLFSKTRFANADHLFGIAAECALKAIMLSLGMVLRPNGKPVDAQYKKHINDLWNEFISFATGRAGGRYATALLGIANPFADWDIGQRYEHQSRFVQNDVQRHQHGAKTTIQILQQAIIDGVIS